MKDRASDPLLDKVERASQQSETEFKVYSYRWVVLLVFALASFSVGVMITSFSVIAPITEKSTGFPTKPSTSLSRSTCSCTFQR